jgi:hypothetical protein
MQVYEAVVSGLDRRMIILEKSFLFYKRFFI